MQTQPLAFAANRQIDIDDAEYRKDCEAEAFSEIAAVLKKHGLQKKYGVALLHKHFDLNDDEMLVEYTDFENRTLISKPVKIDDVRGSKLIETTWCLDSDVAMAICVVFCHFSQAAQQHRGVHEGR